jgi:acetylornithine deacetylase/succinyl-diaminopimelate desuccinylase-like protein
MYNHQIHWNFGLLPIEPVIKKTDIHPEGAIFARGSCDDNKMYMHVKALEYMVQSTLCLVMSMIEGEEEIGSKV